MKKKEWKKVTRYVWVCGDWAVEHEPELDYAELFHSGEFVRDFQSVQQAKRGATQRTLDQVAAWREQSISKPPGLAKLKEVVR